MEPTKVYPIVAVLSLVTVEYGGWALLTFISSRRGQLNDFQIQFFRAGHAHAGVLLVLSLVYFLYLGTKTDFSENTQWIVGAILLAGILAQSGGFLVHFRRGRGRSRLPGHAADALGRAPHCDCARGPRGRHRPGVTAATMGAPITR